MTETQLRNCRESGWTEAEIARVAALLAQDPPLDREACAREDRSIARGER
jgi:hypothetical protein